MASAVMTQTREAAVLAGEMSRLYAALLAADMTAEAALISGDLDEYETAAADAARIVSQIDRAETELSILRYSRITAA